MSPQPLGEGRMAERALDNYWRGRDLERARARSQDRAQDAVSLLAARGISSGRLLDAGCGPGWSLEVFSRAGFDVVGFDASPLAVEMARGAGFDVRLVDIEAEAAERALGELGEFLAVTALEFLEHVRDPCSALERLAKLLRKPGGALVASLPNEIHLKARLEIFAGRLPFGGHRDPHVRHFDLRRALELFEDAGFRARGVRYQSIFPPRAAILRRLFAPVVRIVPGLFAISATYLLEAHGRGNE